MPTIQTHLKNHSLTFETTWGIFSPKNIDYGSELLLNTIEVKPTDTILDLGCGYGTIGITLAKEAPQGTVHLVDTNFVAIEYAKKNAHLNGINNTSIYLSNGFKHIRKDQRFDIIVSNIPAKVGNELLTEFIDDAYTYLNPDGKFYVVTVAGLKDYIKRKFKEQFGNYKKVKTSKTYTVAYTIKGYRE